MKLQKLANVYATRLPLLYKSTTCLMQIPAGFGDAQLWKFRKICFLSRSWCTAVQTYSYDKRISGKLIKTLNCHVIFIFFVFINGLSKMIFAVDQATLVVMMLCFSLNVIVIFSLFEKT